MGGGRFQSSGRKNFLALRADRSQWKFTTDAKFQPTVRRNDEKPRSKKISKEPRFSLWNSNLLGHFPVDIQLKTTVGKRIMVRTQQNPARQWKKHLSKQPEKPFSIYMWHKQKVRSPERGPPHHHCLSHSTIINSFDMTPKTQKENKLDLTEIKTLCFKTCASRKWKKQPTEYL